MKIENQINEDTIILINDDNDEMNITIQTRRNEDYIWKELKIEIKTREQLDKIIQSLGYIGSMIFPTSY